MLYSIARGWLPCAASCYAILAIAMVLVIVIGTARAWCRCSCCAVLRGPASSPCLLPAIAAPKANRTPARQCLDPDVDPSPPVLQDAGIWERVGGGSSDPLRPFFLPPGLAVRGGRQQTGVEIPAGDRCLLLDWAPLCWELPADQLGHTGVHLVPAQGDSWDSPDCLSIRSWRDALPVSVPSKEVPQRSLGDPIPTPRPVPHPSAPFPFSLRGPAPSMALGAVGRR